MQVSNFENLVRLALNELPGEFRTRMDNVDVVVEERPTKNQLIGVGLNDDQTLLGLYEGIPLPERYDYNLVLPDKITLFKEPIESICETDDDIVREIRDTITHEVAHHFGIDDEELKKLGVN